MRGDPSRFHLVKANRAASRGFSQPFWPLGRCVSQVWPDCGSTCVNPDPAGGFGMRTTCWQAGHWIWRPANWASHFNGWSQWEQ